MIIEILLAVLVFSFLMLGFVAWKFYKLVVNFLPAGILHPAEAPREEARKGILSSWKYKFMLLKAYFDNGYSLTSYPKWALAIAGIGSAIKGYSLLWLVGGAMIYGILCLFIGIIFIKFGFLEMQQEVSNQFNLFVKELRERKNI